MVYLVQLCSWLVQVLGMSAVVSFLLINQVYGGCDSNINHNRSRNKPSRTKVRTSDALTGTYWGPMVGVVQGSHKRADQSGVDDPVKPTLADRDPYTNDVVNKEDTSVDIRSQESREVSHELESLRPGKPLGLQSPGSRKAEVDLAAPGPGNIEASQTYIDSDNDDSAGAAAGHAAGAPQHARRKRCAGPGCANVALAQSAALRMRKIAYADCVADPVCRGTMAKRRLPNRRAANKRAGPHSLPSLMDYQRDKPTVSNLLDLDTQPQLWNRGHRNLLKRLPYRRQSQQIPDAAYPTVLRDYFQNHQPMTDSLDVDALQSDGRRYMNGEPVFDLDNENQPSLEDYLRNSVRNDKLMELLMDEQASDDEEPAPQPDYASEASRQRLNQLIKTFRYELMLASNTRT